MRRLRALRRAAAFLALLAGTRLAAQSPTPTPRPASGPPFDIKAPTPHRITASLDSRPTRDLLLLITGGDGATAALKRLKESHAIAVCLKAQGIDPDDFFGRVVATAAGTPDPLLASFAKSASLYTGVLDAIEKDGAIVVQLAAARVASMLPTTRRVEAELVVVPFLGTGGFAEVVPVRDDGTLYLLADLPRLTGENLNPVPPREVMLALLREVCSEAWKDLFASNFKKPPEWPVEKEPRFDALLSISVSSGPAALFLVPDEFYPIGLLLDEPIARAFARWNKAVELLQDPLKKDADRHDILLEATRGDFWRKFGTVVGAYMADELIRRAGREAYLTALASGPRAVARLYLEKSKGQKVPQLGPAARKALESAPPTPTPTLSLSELRSGPGAAATR